MKRVRTLYFIAVVVALVGSLGLFQSERQEVGGAQRTVETAPELKLDTSWPKPLPNGWVLGEAPGVAMDSRDHIWVVQRYRGVKNGKAAPPVMEFDKEGNYIHGWGGPGAGFECAFPAEIDIID